MRTASLTWSSVSPPSSTTRSWERMQLSQPLIALTARQKSSKSVLLRRHLGEALHPQAGRLLAVLVPTRPCAGSGSRRCSSPSARRPPWRRRPPRDRPAAQRVARGWPARSWGLRAAMAQATATPQSCARVSVPGCSTLCRFSSQVLRRVRDGVAQRLPARSSTGLLHLLRERLLALLPVAGAELVGLESVEHAEHLVDVAADAQVVHARPSG